MEAIVRDGGGRRRILGLSATSPSRSGKAGVGRHLGPRYAHTICTGRRRDVRAGARLRLAGGDPTHLQPLCHTVGHGRVLFGVPAPLGVLPPQSPKGEARPR